MDAMHHLYDARGILRAMEPFVSGEVEADQCDRMETIHALHTAAASSIEAAIEAEHDADAKRARFGRLPPARCEPKGGESEGAESAAAGA